MAAIKGLSTHMARNATDPKTAERLAIVAAEADRLQSIVEGFLSFSRGLDDLKCAPTHPYEIVRELGVLLETRAEEAGVTIETGGDEALVLDADPRKLRQALLNIVLTPIPPSPRSHQLRHPMALHIYTLPLPEVRRSQHLSTHPLPRSLLLSHLSILRST